MFLRKSLNVWPPSGTERSHLDYRLQAITKKSDVIGDSGDVFSECRENPKDVDEEIRMRRG